MAMKQDEYSMMSVTREMGMHSLGTPNPSDLLTSMLDYTEQSTGSPDQPGQESLTNSYSRDRVLAIGESTSPDLRQVFRIRRSSASIIKLDQSKWKPVSMASKCASSACRQRFTSILLRPRNCSMCGDVFCRGCTNYRRKLSVNAKPDPLGTFFHVCKVCYDFRTASGTMVDHMREFSEHRRNLIGRKQSTASSDLRNPLCGQKSSVLKRISLKHEVGKLVEGYRANSGLIKGMLSEVKVPSWQKLAKWVEPSKASVCFNCDGQFGLFSRFQKTNCRVGGQVFCPGCCKDEIVIYSEENDVNWAINGKPGAPKSTPSNYKLLPVCCNCSNDLQVIVQERTRESTPDTSATSVYLEKLHQMHQKLSELEDKIESTLPEYLKIVDALDMTDNSPRSIDGRTPLQVLVKVQIDLSDAFSSLAVRSQKLKLLKPETQTESKLHRHIMIGTYQYYSENMFQFRLAKNRLSELMPTDHLEEIQLDVSQRSMERVHVYLQQLMFELLDLKKRHTFSDDFFEPIIATILNIEEELKPFLESRKESWVKQSECALDFVKGELEAGRRAITVDVELKDPCCVRYIIMSQISSRVHECYRELQAKTVDREFCKTKESVREAFTTLDRLLTHTKF